MSADSTGPEHKDGGTGMGGRPLIRLALALAILAAAVASVGLWAYQRYVGPGPLAAEVTVVVPRGGGLSSIATQLAAAGVVRSPMDMVAATRLTGTGRRLKAGEYAFPAGISLKGVLDLLQGGRTVTRRLTVPEGLTSAQIVALVAAEAGLSGDVGPVPPEGSLLPETYHFSYGDERAALLRRMRDAMRTELTALWDARSPNLPFDTVQDAVTLASIVEKETGIAAERARVAGVFINRMRLGMRLQSDPTIIYALSGGKGPIDRPLTRADWKLDSPYNTYEVAGLPPGPIANPGRLSLKATLNPERHDFLYFVADGTGGHAFAETLDDHNRNVARWRAARDAEP